MTVRSASVQMHEQVRELILSGELPAGSVISQVELSNRLGVSRTPLREALRMLQEEGLIESEPHRRNRVTGFDPVELDSIYGTRLMLEALAMRVSLPQLGADDFARAAELLAELDTLGGPAAGRTWQETHHEFHRVFVHRAPAPLVDLIRSQAQRSERYLNQLAHAGAVVAATAAAEHLQILRRAQAGDTFGAIAATAHHLARTAMLTLADSASHVEGSAVRAALEMIAGAGAGAGADAAGLLPHRST